MALVAAAKANNRDEVKRLLQSNDVNEADNDGQTALHVSAQKGNLEVVKMLLTKKANVNAKDGNGWTPLHCAASTGQFKICERLLQQKNIEITNNNDGASALFYVVRHNGQYDPIIYHNVLSLLLDRGANLNARNNFGESPLHSACLRGNIDAVRFLVLNRADLNIVNRTGETCLHYAIRASKTDFVRLLLEAGANPSAPSERGTPLEVANRVNNKEIINLVTEKLKNPLGTIDRFKDALKAGYLSVHVKKTRWQRLFFIIKDNQCWYFKSDLEQDPIGVFDMTQTIFKEVPDKFDKMGCFKFETTSKAFLMSAGSDVLRTAWFCALRAAAAWKPAMSDSSSATNITVTLNARELRELDEERLKSELFALSQAPGNRLCADCNQRDPFWVSMEVGVFLCPECAMLHQQLRISSIKCIFSTNDRWTNDHVNMLKSHGNIRVNAMLEKNLPDVFDWIQPDDSMEKKESFIKSKYIVKAYKAKEEASKTTVLPEEMAFQYKMSRYAALEFRNDYDRLLEMMSKQLRIPLKNLRTMLLSTTHRLYTSLVTKYLNGEGDLRSPEKHAKYRYLAASTELMRAVIEATKFVKDALKNKSIKKEEFIRQFQEVVNVFEDCQSECEDLHVKLIFQWWIPQFLEMLVVLDSRNLVCEAVANSLAATLTRNCATVLLLLSGEYLYDTRLEMFVESTSPQQRREEDFKKLFELLKEKNRQHTEALRKDVSAISKEHAQSSSSKMRRSASTTHGNTNVDEEESMNETSANGLYRMSDVEDEPDTELPLLKMWNKGPLLHSLFAFIRELPGDTAKQLLQVEHTGKSSKATGNKNDTARVSRFATNSLDNLLLNRTDRVPFFEKLSGFLSFLSQLQNVWPEDDDDDGNGLLTAEAKQHARRQVFVLNFLLKDLISTTSPFMTPEVLLNWGNLVQILHRGVDFLLIGAELNLPRATVRPVLTLLSALINWSVTQFACLQQVDQLFLGVRFN